MISHTTGQFWKAYNLLPQTAKKHARTAYRMFEQNPFHPGLQFKRVHLTKPIYAVRITLHYRALGLRDGESIVWFWIGSHADYDNLLRQL